MSKNKRVSNIGAFPHKSPLAGTMKPEVAAALDSTMGIPTLTPAPVEPEAPHTVQENTITDCAMRLPKLVAQLAYHIVDEGVITQTIPYTTNDDLNAFVAKVRDEGITFQAKDKPRAEIYFPAYIRKVVVTIRTEENANQGS